MKDKIKIERGLSLNLSLTNSNELFFNISEALVIFNIVANIKSPTKFPTQHTNKSNKKDGLLSSTKPIFTVYNHNLKLTITNKPNANIKAPNSV